MRIYSAAYSGERQGCEQTCSPPQPEDKGTGLGAKARWGEVKAQVALVSSGISFTTAWKVQSMISDFQQEFSVGEKLRTLIAHPKLMFFVNPPHFPRDCCLFYLKLFCFVMKQTAIFPLYPFILSDCLTKPPLRWPIFAPWSTQQVSSCLSLFINYA